ncbi:MAG: hypothetical protein JST83_12335 [Bacteroidetes bacterium]|nr:hypothetical protein [Bacteroidota bacterium]
MRIPAISCFILLTGLLASCVRSTPASYDGEIKEPAVIPAVYVFGASFGECGSNCVHSYRLVKGGTYTYLLASSLDHFAREPDSFAIMITDTNLLAKAISFFSTIPAEFTDSTGPVRFGCPDCTDGGALYLSISKTGVAQENVIDPHLEYRPAMDSFVKRLFYIQIEILNPYVDSVKTTLKKT